LTYSFLIRYVDRHHSVGDCPYVQLGFIRNVAAEVT
jgi:hypothetical protein